MLRDAPKLWDLHHVLRQEPYLCARSAGVLQDAIIVKVEALCEGIREVLDVVVLHESAQFDPRDAGLLCQYADQGLHSLVVHSQSIVCLGLSCL